MRKIFVKQMLEIFKGFDVMITPETVPAGASRAWHGSARYYPFNDTGFPGMAVPAGFSTSPPGLPLSIQIVGKPFDEESVSTRQGMRYEVGNPVARKEAAAVVRAAAATYRARWVFTCASFSAWRGSTYASTGAPQTVDGRRVHTASLCPERRARDERPKFGCGLGQCGRARLSSRPGDPVVHHADSRLVAGGDITTLEGLGTPDKPHPIQQAFIDEQPRSAVSV
jgi:hypothetical protein